MKNFVAVSLLLLIATPIFAQFQAPDPTPDEFHLRIGWTPTYYAVDVKTASVPINPADSGFLSGNTNVKANSGVDWTGFTLGIERTFWQFELFGLNIIPKAGFDAQFSLLSLDNDRKDNLYGYRQQSSDPRPSNEGSFVYDKLTPGWFTPIPFIGLNIDCGNNWYVCPEIGLTYKEFTREYGDHRFGKESSIYNHGEWRFGVRPALFVGYQVSDFNFSAYVAWENYNYSFGNVQGYTLGVFCVIKL